MSELLPKIREIAERVASSEGMEVLEVDLRGGHQAMLRIVIDKPAGITHEDCEVISRQVGAILDVEDVIPQSYTLEVSSPGAERKLTRPEDFIRFTGKMAKVVLKEPMPPDAGGGLAGQGSIRGRLAECRDGVLTLEISGRKGAMTSVTINLDNVARANLVLEW